MKNLSERLKYYITTYTPIKSIREFERKIGWKNSVVNNLGDGISTERLRDVQEFFPELNTDWLLNGKGSIQNIASNFRQIQPNREIDTVDEINIPDFVAEDDVIYNSFNNKFEKLPNGEYLMYMPLFEWDVAAGLLDHDGDTRHPDYEDVAQHVVVVKEPLKGKYSAFRIKGGSMEGTEVNRYIPDGSIVWGRELQRIHWEYPLRLSRFPLWVIGSTEFGRPTLKEIISHDVTTATIVVDSWNPSIEYAHNVPISLNTVKMLYYVFKIETPVADIY